MKFPNAHNGLKKLLAGEILTFVAGFLLLVTGIFAAVTEAVSEKSAADEGTQAALILISLASMVGGILYIVYLIRAIRMLKNN